MRLALLVAFALACGTVKAQYDFAERLDHYVKASQRDRELAIEKVRAKLEAIDNRRADARKQRQSRAHRSEIEADAERVSAELDAASSPMKEHYASLRVADVTVGCIGRLEPEARIKILQVLDDTSAIATAAITHVRPAVNYVQNGRVRHIPRSTDTTTRQVALRGVNTSLFSDGSQYEGADFFWSPETYTYETVAGSTKTIPVLIPFDCEQHRLRFTKWHEARTWTAASGKSRMEAVLGGYRRGRITLYAESGKSKQVDLDALSDDDKAYVREWRKAQRD